MTKMSKLWFASRFENGKRHSPGVLQAREVLLDVRMRAHERIEGDRFAGLDRVTPPVSEVDRREETLPGAGMQRLAPDDETRARGVGRKVNETRSSIAAAPSRSFPSWRIADCQHSSSPIASKIAASTWVFLLATTAKPTFRERHAERKPSVQPAESERITTSLRTRDGSSRWTAPTPWRGPRPSPTSDHRGYLA